MDEAFLQFVWKNRLYNETDLKTTVGEKLKIKTPGSHNTDAGPDFISGIVIIENQVWAGNIEIHTFSSEWYLHKHQADPAYNNVILHVVYEDDSPVQTSSSRTLPTLELKNRIHPNAYKQYQLFMHRGSIPCADDVGKIGEDLISQVLSRELEERFQRKANEINQLIEITNGDVKEALYRTLARNFGFRINSIPFSLLAASLPYRLLEKNLFNPFVVEALLFGVAGFLEADFHEPYPHQLRKEFEYQKKKYDLDVFPKSIWKKSRLRPNNFPVIRVAQFSSLMALGDHVLSDLYNFVSVDSFYELFGRIEPHPYWRSHYDFDKPVSGKSAVLGKSAIDNILINTVIPFLYMNGLRLGDRIKQTKAIELLHKVAPEKNGIIKKWTDLGVAPRNAAESQALIQLKNEKCTSKKCVSCAIGENLIIRNL